MCNNSTLDLVNMNEYIWKKFLSICSQDIEQKRNSGVNKGDNYGTKVQKIMSKNPNLVLVNMNPYKICWNSVNLFSRFWAEAKL